MTMTNSEVRAIEELTNALRFTVEYVGFDTLPPIVGWSWYDAMVKYAPAKAAAMKEVCEANQANSVLDRIAEAIRTGDFTPDVMSKITDEVVASGRPIDTTAIASYVPEETRVMPIDLPLE